MRNCQLIYCEKSFFDEIITNRKKETKLAYSIISHLGHIIIDMTENDLKNLSETNPIYKSLIKRGSKSIISDEKWKQQFSANDIADEMFFVNPGVIEDVKRIRSLFGGLIVDGLDGIMYLKRIQRPLPFNFIPKKDKPDFDIGGVYDSWAEVFSQKKLEPYNAMLITDNYMFSEKFDKRKKYSLYALLMATVPESCEVDFHLTIFTCNSNGNLSKEKAEQIVSEIKALNLNSRLKVSFVAHTKSSTTHDRHILTNYNYIYAGKGFSIIDSEGVQEESKGAVQSIFDSLDNLDGGDNPSTIKGQYDIVQAALKKIYDQKEGMTKNLSFTVGDTFTNRLLK